MNPAADQQAWALVHKAQAGDREAFADLYRLYHGQVHAYIWHRVGHSARATADELAAEVWLRAWQNIGRVHDIGRDFGAWLNTIARNIVIDHHKSARHQREMLAGDLRDRTVAAPDETGPEAAALAADTQTGLVAAMRGLESGRQREALALRYLAGMSVQECSERLGCDVGAVKALTWRGTRALRRAMIQEAH